MGVELGLHFLGQRRALFLFGFFQSMPRAVLGGLFILRLTGEGFAGLAEFYDIVFRHYLPRRNHQFRTHNLIKFFLADKAKSDSFFA